MNAWMLDAGHWMLDHGFLVLWAIASLCAAVMITRMRRRWRRRVKRRMMTLDTTGWRRLSAAAVLYDREMVDAIADRSFAAGIFVGALGLVAVMLVIIVLCLRGSENRPRNGRRVS